MSTYKLYRRVKGFPLLALWPVFLLPGIFIFMVLLPIPGTAGTVAPLILPVPLTALVVFAVARQLKDTVIIQKVNLLKNPAVPAPKGPADIRKAMRIYRYHDDTHTPVKDHTMRLVPAYPGIIRELGRLAVSVENARTRAELLQEVSELNTEWSSAIMDYELESDHFVDQANTTLDWLGLSAEKEKISNDTVLRPTEQN